MKQLLELLLSKCLKRDFKTKCSDGQMRYTGMCMIIEDMYSENIISAEEFKKLKEFLGVNTPPTIKNGGYWCKDNNKRIEFLEKHIKNDNISKIS